MLAAITAQSLVWVLIWIVVAGLLFWLANWAIDATGIPDPFRRVAKVVIILVAVLFLVNALLTLVGKPFISW